MVKLASDGLYHMTCAVCGKAFVAFSPKAKYCGEKCRKLAQRRNIAKKNPNMARPQTHVDSYLPTGRVRDALLGNPFSGGRRAVDAIQGTSTKVKKRGER